MFGLSEKNIIEIKSIIEESNEVESALIFGSRAKGNYKATSDIDITIKGSNITYDTILTISNKLNEESSMPFHFDIIDYNTIKNEELIKHIKEYGLSFYTK